MVLLCPGYELNRRLGRIEGAIPYSGVWWITRVSTYPGKDGATIYTAGLMHFVGGELTESDRAACRLDRPPMKWEPEDTGFQPRDIPMIRGKWYVVDGEEAALGAGSGAVDGPFDDQAAAENCRAIKQHPEDYFTSSYTGPVC